MDTWTLGLGILLMSGISATVGLQVSIPQTIYEHARGDEVTITCNFQPKNPVNRLIVISWTADPDGSFDDEGITFGTFYSDINHVDINAMYEGKAHIEGDVNKRESKLLLKHVTLRESRRIKCFVQIPGDTEGQTSDSTSLIVLVAPSDPVCRIKGTTEYGQNINLTCVSEEGSPAPTYQWQSYDVKNVPQPFPPKTSEKDGVLSLFNVSRDTSGYYICTSTNKIHSAKCNLTLSVMPPTMKIGATAGIIGGCVSGVAVLILIIYCCCRDKQQPEEFAMEPPMIEYHDNPKQEKPEDGSRDVRKTSIEGNIDHRERYEMKAEEDSNDESHWRFNHDNHQEHSEGHGERRDIYSRGPNKGRQEQYDNHKALYNNRYDDRRSEYDNLRDRYDSRHDQQERYSKHSDHYYDRQDRPNDDRNYDNRQEHYSDHKDCYDKLHDRCDDDRDQYCQNRFDDDRSSFDGRRENYDDRRGRYHNQRYHYGDRQDHYNDHKDG